VGAATLGEAVGVLAAAVELVGAAEAVMEVPEVLTGPVVPVAEEAAELVEEAAELVEELQAVNRTATHAREAQDATCRGLRALLIWPPAAAGVICMVFQPFNQRAGGSASHVTSTTPSVPGGLENRCTGHEPRPFGPKRRL
jgi:hypothetical protein